MKRFKTNIRIKLTGINKSVNTAENARCSDILISKETKSNSLIKRDPSTRWNWSAKPSTEWRFYQLSRVLRSYFGIYIHILMNTAEKKNYFTEFLFIILLIFIFIAHSFLSVRRSNYDEAKGFFQDYFFLKFDVINLFFLKMKLSQFF